MKIRTAILMRYCVMEMILLAICGGLACAAPGFFTSENLLNILRNISMQGIIAFGMTMAIIAGEIDLSVGSAAAFSGCLTAFITQSLSARGVAPWMAVAVAVTASGAAGFAIGGISGVMRMSFRVPTFISTLGWMTVLSGAAYLITGGFPLTPFPDGYNFLGGGYLAGVPFPAILFILVFAISTIVMEFTTFGRAVYAVGGNPESARLSGINVYGVKVMVMGIVGLLAAFSGILLSAQIMAGSPGTAKGWELDVISAVIIGGTSLQGGEGRIRGTLVGVIFLGVLVNGMTLLNISEYWQLVVRGALILGAVLVNRLQTQRME